MKNKILFGAAIFFALLFACLWLRPVSNIWFLVHYCKGHSLYVEQSHTDVYNNGEDEFYLNHHQVAIGCTWKRPELGPRAYTDNFVLINVDF